MSRPRRILAAPLAASAAALLAAPLAGCGIPPTAPAAAGEAPRVAPEGVQLYFVRDGNLYPTVRRVTDPATARDPLEAVKVLTTGPTAADRAARLGTAMPAGLDAFPIRRARPENGGRSLPVFLTADPRLLPVLAAEQIACTAVAASAMGGLPYRAVTFFDKPGHERGPVGCPIPLPAGPKRAR